MTGTLITIEGADGCGKSTHVRLLSKWLKEEGKNVLVTVEPTDEPIGKILKSSLRGEINFSVETEALLFAADRINHVRQIIQPALESGKIVIAERYVYSSMAYQSVRGLPLDWVKEINEAAPIPDLAIVLDIPAEAAFNRIKRSRKLDTFEKDLELQKKVRDKYLEIAKSEGLAVVNSQGSVKEVQLKIREIVSEHLKA